MKTEKDKMLAGKLYDGADNELITRWYIAKQLQTEYNNTPTTDAAKMSSILDELVGSRGENVWIAAPFFVDYGENIHLGRNVEINMNCVFPDCNRITVGYYSGIGPGCIYTRYFTRPMLLIDCPKKARLGGPKRLLWPSDAACGLVVGQSSYPGLQSATEQRSEPVALSQSRYQIMCWLSEIHAE